MIMGAQEPMTEKFEPKTNNFIDYKAPGNNDEFYQ
jgi:hypothetical protein